MKELSIEEKAKAYDEAIQRARQFMETPYLENSDDVVGYIFPELKESENEKIRKRIIALVNAHGQGMYKDDMIAWLEKQGEQKPAWSEEDESWFKELELMALSFSNDDSYRKKFFDWFNSLKDRVQPQPKQEWKQENIGDLTDFENAMMHIGGSFFGENAGLDPNDTNVIKEQANLLLELVPRQEWSEEDKTVLNNLIYALANDRIGNNRDEYVDWLKSLRPQSHWKPSDEQIEAVKCVQEGVFRLGILVSLFNDFKKLK